jgi:hypothetical protein
LAPLGEQSLKLVFYRITDRLRSKYDQEADWLSKWNNGTNSPGTDADYRGEIE